jgi:hypothetical protein
VQTFQHPAPEGAQLLLRRGDRCDHERLPDGRGRARARLTKSSELVQRRTLTLYRARRGSNARPRAFPARASQSRHSLLNTTLPFQGQSPRREKTVAGRP